MDRLARKYDDLDYHLGGEYPAGLAEEHGWTHIGVFLIWLIEKGLHSREWAADVPEFAAAVARIPARAIEPRDLIDLCDATLASEMLNAEGNAFTASMYDRYLEMFESRALAEVNRPFLRRLGFGPVLTAYHVDPGWLTYDVVAPKIDELYREWSSTRSSDWMRNYGAMGDEKLLRCLDELRHEEGEAFDRVIERGGDVARNRVAAEAVARERGLI